MRAAKDLTGDPALALHFGESVDLAEMSVFGLLASAGTTPEERLSQLNRYAPLAVDLPGAEGERFQIQRSDDRLWLIDARPNPNDFVELTESTFARIVCSMRRVAGDRILVAAVHVTHAAPGHRDEYDRIFRAPIVFGSNRNALVTDAQWLGLTPSQNAGYAADVLKDHAEVLLERLAKSRSMSGRVEALLLPMLQSGEASVAAVASRLGVSRQSLFRKLRAEGVTFEKILDDVRCRMARHYLEAEKMSVSEAAYRLGFADPGAFSRAFKRWTGFSPGTLLKNGGRAAPE
jgi:AraC-like DNA-binding protein